MKTLPTSLKNKLLPLLLTLAVNQAYAAGIVYTGIDGASGLIGTAPGQHGGAGVPLSAALGQAQAALTLTLYGGVGGQGGSANGAIATSTSAALDTVVAALFYGGRGGVGGAAGGLAEMTDNGDIWGPFNPIYGASGVGGNGGVATSWASATVGVDGLRSQSGAGGGASATAYGQSDTGKVGVSAEARGGAGGEPGGYFGGTPGLGADVEQINAVSGRSRGDLTLVQRAVAGRAGPGGVADAGQPAPDGVRSANARSALTVSDATAASLSARVSAVGGGAGVSPVPEPSSWLMLALGLGSLVLVARRRAGPSTRA